ncbi:hypothetical protein DO70_4979 [Burkholderia pseudomallei]|nr:hypothetical protein DO70_4979 [Burkholderia pseudomallei]
MSEARRCGGQCGGQCGSNREERSGRRGDRDATPRHHDDRLPSACAVALDSARARAIGRESCAWLRGHAALGIGWRRASRAYAACMVCAA